MNFFLMCDEKLSIFYPSTVIIYIDKEKKSPIIDQNNMPRPSPPVGTHTLDFTHVYNNTNYILKWKKKKTRTHCLSLC